MQSVTVTEREAGRHLIRYLMRLLPRAPGSLLYKGLRENRFRINGVRTHDREYVLKTGDSVSLYFTDEQLAQFGFLRKLRDPVLPERTEEIGVVYEDDELLLLNKPVGLLSQKNAADSVSVNEIGLEMLRQRGVIASSGFTPGVLNRLDRNTSGIVIFPKTLAAAQTVSALLRERGLAKYYAAVVCGDAAWQGSRRLLHYFQKDERNNRLTVFKRPAGDGGENPVICEAEVLDRNPKHHLSLLRIHLITGKSHQIRAQLAEEGLPILGDPKYRTEKEHREDKERFGVAYQMLCAYELDFFEAPPPLTALVGKRIRADLPETMKTIVTHYFHEEVLE